MGKFLILSFHWFYMPFLSHVTFEEYQAIVEASPAIILPVGSIEWHDAHLPLGLDYLKIETLAKLIADEVGCLYAPAIAFGYPKHFSNESLRGIGTICPEYDSLFRYILALGRAFVEKDFRVIVLLTGHYERSQVAMLKLVARLLVDYARERGKTLIAFCHQEADYTLGPGISGNAREDQKRPGLEFTDGGDHAGFYETSLAHHLIPGLVRSNKVDPRYHDPDRGGAPSRDWGERWTRMIVSKATHEIRAALNGEELPLGAG